MPMRLQKSLEIFPILATSKWVYQWLGALSFCVFVGSIATAQETPTNPNTLPDLNFKHHPFSTFDTEDGLTANIQLADVDSDGDLDALVANGRHWAQQDYVFFNSGNGRLLEGALIGTRLSASYIICPGDFNADGTIDLVVVRDNLPAQIYLNDGKGNFEFQFDIAGTGGPARSAIVVDADDDGFSDIVIVRRREPDLILYGKQEDEFFDVEKLPGKGRGSTGVATGDLDGDGDQDIVIARRDSAPSVLLRNQGNRTFEETELPDSLGDHRKALIDDFDGDTKLDIILLSVDGLHKFFSSAASSNLSSITLFGEQGLKAQALATGDLDNDGDLDLVEGSETANAYYLNNGKGEFHRRVFEMEVADTYGVALGDMNGDGLLDIVFANSGAENLILLAK